MAERRVYENAEPIVPIWAHVSSIVGATWSFADSSFQMTQRAGEWSALVRVTRANIVHTVGRLVACSGGSYTHAIVDPLDPKSPPLPCSFTSRAIGDMDARGWRQTHLDRVVRVAGDMRLLLGVTVLFANVSASADLSAEPEDVSAALRVLALNVELSILDANRHIWPSMHTQAAMHTQATMQATGNDTAPTKRDADGDGERAETKETKEAKETKGEKETKGAAVERVVAAAKPVRARLKLREELEAFASKVVAGEPIAIETIVAQINSAWGARLDVRVVRAVLKAMESRGLVFVHADGLTCEYL